MTVTLSTYNLLRTTLVTAAAWTTFCFAQGPGSFRSEYEVIGYDAEPRHNPVARLAEKLASGEMSLEYQAPRGYLDSLLEALGIDPASQMLVFSPTSLQYQLITDQRPRALYFSEDTYIGYVQRSKIVEVMTLDEKLGIVFYLFHNAPEAEEKIVREDQRCLVCHDTTGTLGGGVPILITLSSVYDKRLLNLEMVSGTGNVDDRTPFAERWGGWYVTGRHGSQEHLGNVLLPDGAGLGELAAHRRGNLDSLHGLEGFDPSPYPRATSDIVALLVLEHQLTVQNQLSYVKFKAPTLLERAGLAEAQQAPDWASLPPAARKALTRMLERLVGTLVMADSLTLTDTIRGSTEFAEWFSTQGPRNGAGLSLRTFDLKRHLFRYPLSYLIYSADFNALPAYAKDYVYARLVEVLDGEEESGFNIPHAPAARREALDILAATKAEFAPYYRALP